MFRLRALILLTAVAMTSGMVLLGGTAQAVSGSAWIHQSVGRSASGAAVVVQVSLTCPAGSTYSVNGFSISQRQPDGSVIGTSNPSSADAGGTCNGATRNLRFDGIAPDKPFVLGAAFVSASVQFCNANQPDCVQRKAVRTVSVQAVTLDKTTFSRPFFSVSLPAQARFEANGAGAVVYVPYRCASMFRGYLSARLAQRRGNAVVQGSDAVDLVCSASNRVGVLAFHPLGYPWRLGDAFVELDGQVIASDFSQGVIGVFAFRTLNLVKPT